MGIVFLGRITSTIAVQWLGVILVALLIGALLPTSGPPVVLAAPAQQWVARYNGPTSWDRATDLAVDGAGNVYVTGVSLGSGTASDYATIKYSSSGAQQWVARYNGPVNGSDEGSALAVDGSGNVYVTGTSYGSVGTNYDYATIEYDSSGIEQWVARYDGPINGGDWANYLAVDGAGNVYVTGDSQSGPTSHEFDYATIKYSSSGVQQWVARYDGPMNDNENTEGLAVDGAGNVYVTGNSPGIGTSLDYATIKYSSSGAQQWVARYNGPATNSYDTARGVAVDGAGNVYVTGGSQEIGASYYDYATIKYSSSGVQQWVARYDGPGDNNDEARSLAVDAAGNVYVTGLSVGSGTGEDYATIKYAAQPTTAVSGSWTMTGGSGSGTHSGGVITGGSFTCVLTYSGDISGTFGTFALTYNPVTHNFEGRTNVTGATITVGGSTYNAQYFASGMAVNVGLSGSYPYYLFGFNPVGGAVCGTLAGEADDWLIMGNSTGGSGSGLLTVTSPSTWTVTNVQVPNGTWSGHAYPLAGPPQIEVVPASSTGTATLTVGGQTVATAQHPNSPTPGAIGIFQYADNPGSVMPGLDLGTYVEFNTNIAPSIWNAPVEIRIYYTDAQVAAAGIDESTLVMYYNNGSHWVQHTNTGVNTSQNYVWAITSHFSPNGAGPAGSSVPTATGSGTANFVPSSGTVQNLAAVSEGSLPADGKPNIRFPHGFFSFEIVGLAPGQSVTLTITLPSAVPVGTQYWKYGPTPTDPTNHWYQIPVGDNDGDNVITITLVDGGLGDDDLTANGTIVDQGGPGWPGPTGGGGVPAFPSIYIGIGAALGAGVLAYLVRRRLVV